jgi:acyl carrier protein
MTTTAESILKIVSKIARKPIENPRFSLRRDVKLDSLDIVEIMTECEELFGITLGDDDLKHCENIQDVADLIDDKMTAAA